jgi:hypothetical protein
MWDNPHIKDYANVEYIPSARELTKAEHLKKKHMVRMSPEETALLMHLVRNATGYFEYGCGGSTTMVCAYAKEANIYFADSDADWLNRVKEQSGCISRALYAGRGRSHLIDIGPTQKWGFPKDEKNPTEKWENYPKALLSVGDAQMDVVLVDGRFRVASALFAFLHQPSAVVLIHDFFYLEHYEKYRHILAVAEIFLKARRLVALRVKKGVTKAELMALYEIQKKIPR